MEEEDDTEVKPIICVAYFKLDTLEEQRTLARLLSQHKELIYNIALFQIDIP